MRHFTSRRHIRRDSASLKDRLLSHVHSIEMPHQGEEDPSAQVRAPILPDPALFKNSKTASPFRRGAQPGTFAPYTHPWKRPHWAGLRYDTSRTAPIRSRHVL